MRATSKKPSALAIIVGRGGRPSSETEGPPPPGDTELEAAQQLIKAIAGGKPLAVVEAYRALKEACEAAY